jgi:hypothetical protein
MKKLGLCLAVLILLAVGGCAADGAQVSVAGSPAQSSGISATPAIVATPETVLVSPPGTEAASVTPSETIGEESEPDVVMLTAYEGGEYLSEVVLEEKTDRQATMDALMEALLSSYAWPAVDMAELQDYIQIHMEYSNGEVSEYCAFETEGGCGLQSDSGEFYAPIRQETYDALRALAKGDA